MSPELEREKVISLVSLLSPPPLLSSYSLTLILLELTTLSCFCFIFSLRLLKFIRMKILRWMTPDSLCGIIFSGDQWFVDWKSFFWWDLTIELRGEINKFFWSHLFRSFGPPFRMKCHLFTKKHSYRKDVSLINGISLEDKPFKLARRVFLLLPNEVTRILWRRVSMNRMEEESSDFRS
jgi:hypothetical protein